MLVLFYLHEYDIPVHELKFRLPPLLLNMLEQDVDVIRRDWEVIREKVSSGKAHELSEGDTFYLGACRKGSGGEFEKLQSQPYSEVPAKSRAFSLKQSYMTQLIQKHNSSSIATQDRYEGASPEAAIEAKFQPYLGRTVEELSEAFVISKRSKAHWRRIADHILAEGPGGKVDIKSDDILMKTVRLKRSGIPRESMSFQSFSYTQICSENWAESSFAEAVESKFLFVVFKEGPDGVERLDRVRYWSMPFQDRLEAQRVWEETRRLANLDSDVYPSSKMSPVAHVRTKGKNSKDLIPTPSGRLLRRRSFWLNAKYIGRILSTL
jgi:DNA mismatch repair protein MutH